MRFKLLHVVPLDANVKSSVKWRLLLYVPIILAVFSLKTLNEYLCFLVASEQIQQRSPTIRRAELRLSPSN